MNRYLRRLQHEQLRSLGLGKRDNPGFYSQNLKDERGQTAIVLTRATAEEVGQWNAEDLARKAEAITDAAGACLLPSLSTPLPSPACRFLSSLCSLAGLCSRNFFAFFRITIFRIAF